MFTFKYPGLNLTEFMHALAEQMGTRMINNQFQVPAAIGKGYVQLVDLPNGLSAFIMNFTLHVDMHYEQSKTAEEIYSLRFEQTIVSNSMTTQIDSDFEEDTRRSHDSVYLVCNFFDLGYFFTEGTRIKCITIQMSRDWLGKYLQMEIFDEIVHHYVSLKTASLHMEPLDAEYRRIMHDIISVEKEHPTHMAMIQNRTMSLIERFFNNLYERRYQVRYQVKASTYDIEQIRKVEQAITADVTEACPTINELARMVSMSPSKLKQLFRDVYGKPIYQYYQFNRMQKAKDMLLSRKFSIKEVGLSLGYSNLSIFSSAFRKEFHVLPSEMAGGNGG